MYRFSRAIYRELAPAIADKRVCPSGPGNHERVLRTCEIAIQRLATDRHYFARPSRTLFNDIRVFFPITAQSWVLAVVERHMTFAQEYFASQPLAGFDLAGNRLECRATTRRGTPCQRIPLPHNGYCPSHQHLADSDEVGLAA